MKIDVNAGLLELVSRASGKEEVRYYLCGVYVHPCHAGGVLMVATDGHRLMVAHDPSGKIEGGKGDEGLIVSNDKAIMKACKPGKVAKRLIVEADPDGKGASTYGSWRVNGEDGSTIAGVGAIVDGAFPDYRRVIPERVAGAKTGDKQGYINPLYVKAFAEIALDWKRYLNEGDKNCHLCIEFNDPTAPGYVCFGDAPMFGVIMPLRHSDGPLTMPDWFTATPAEAEAAA